jgi:uncharacterized membrane protein YhaH (DUF805 family)
MDRAMGWLHLLFGFKGRIGRAQFLTALVVWLVAGLVFFVLSELIAPAYEIGRDAPVLIGLRIVLELAFAASMIAVGIKRLHDRNKSPWWLVVFYVVPVLALPIVAWFVTAMAPALFYAGMLIALWALVELGFVRGSIGTNSFGPDPAVLAPVRTPASGAGG